MQDADVYRDADRSLCFFDAHLDGNFLFFSACNFNGLFRVEIEKTEAEFLGHFSGEKMWQRNLHRQVFCVGSRLFFIPYQGKGISIYNKETKEFSFVDIKEKEHISISRAFLVQNDIYMMPYDLKTPFILFYTENSRYEILNQLCENICSQLQNPDNNIWAMYGTCVVDHNMFLEGDDGVILCADLKSWQVHAYKLPKAYKIHNLFFDGKEFYFTLHDKCWIIRWDPDTGRCQEYKIADTLENGDPPYITMLRWQDHLLLLPNHEKDILEFDEKKNEWCVKTDYIPKGFRRKKEGLSLFFGYQLINDKLLLLPFMGNGMVILSEKESRLCEILYPEKFSENILEIKKKYIMEQVAQGNILYEKNEVEYDLRDMLSALPDIIRESEAGGD